MFKKYLLLLTLISLFGDLSAQNKRESFRIFGVKIKAKDVTGIKNFNEMGLKYFTRVIHGLTEDSSTYLWRLGSVRVNYKDYTDGTIDLFNLSHSNHFSGFQLLDSIDFTYYRNWGFQILEKREPLISNDPRYESFKDSISNPILSLGLRRQILWRNSNKDYREKLLLTRVFVNNQLIALNKKVVKKISANIQATLKTNLNDLLKMTSKVVDTTTNQQVDSLKLALFFSRTFDRTINLQGNYITAVLQTEYLNQLSTIINQIEENSPIADPSLDQFNFYLRDYLQGPQSSEYATNSALFAFKFTGSLDKTLTSKDSLASTLSALFNIGSTQAAHLATTAGIVFSRQVTETFQNQFSKVWIIKFGSDQKFEELHFKSTTKREIGK